jgi:hypothetical protein
MTGADNANRDPLFCDEAAIMDALPEIFLVDLLHLRRTGSLDVTALSRELDSPSARQTSPVRGKIKSGQRLAAFGRI